MKNIVIVESPAKAKTINRYLGKDFTVLASFGHIRDLPAKNGSVMPDQDFAMLWEVDARAQKHIQEIVKAVKGADTLYLATDPDREGEAISWHVEQVLRDKGLLKNVEVHRIVFYEITQAAIKQALASPRPVHQPLVEAYLARRALDYLVGFSLSPVLWRKLPGARSAGRVQSVALRLIVDRETEIEAFKSQEYWSIEGHFLSEKKVPFTTRLTHLGGKKLDKFDLNTQELAQAACQDIKLHNYHVDSIERRQVNRHPAPPFSTSTLQQEASRKLGFGASRTMQLAQRLYEGIEINGETTGLITYMRTDSTQMANEAVEGARSYIKDAFGAPYVPAQPRQFKSKAKNAQEAHEAIRPTVLSRTPKDVRSALDDNQFKLYELIWKRAVASQMASALLDQVGADIISANNQVILRATGSTLVFDGFLKLYQESKDDDDDSEKEGALPPLNKGEETNLQEAIPAQHFTQPPPRYSEASLVKKLTELGIGRPSTYASIISVLQERDYVYLDKRQFIPEDRGRIVTAFLLNFFRRYVEYDFTANLEEQLDEISAGERPWKNVMQTFWEPFIEKIRETQELKPSDILVSLEHDLEAFLFPTDDPELRRCPTCGTGELHLKLSKFGGFLGCSRYPECRYTRSTTAGNADGAASQSNFEPTSLGADPETQEDITLRKGPYGFYLQWDSANADPKKKPKRISVVPPLDPETVNLEQALSLRDLPKPLGQHPETQEQISVGIGRFGPYVKYGSQFVSIPKTFDFLALSLEEALTLIARKQARPARPKRSFKGKTKSATPRKTKRKT
jgi:DNA topoisomerase-1